MFKSIVVCSLVSLSSFISFSAFSLSDSKDNSLVAASPSIAVPSVYGQDKKDTSSTPQIAPSQNDVLVSKPRDVIGGSEHQRVSITPYLGVNY